MLSERLEQIAANLIVKFGDRPETQLFVRGLRVAAEDARTLESCVVPAEHRESVRVTRERMPPRPPMRVCQIVDLDHARKQQRISDMATPTVLFTDPPDDVVFVSGEATESEGGDVA